MSKNITILLSLAIMVALAFAACGSSSSSLIFPPTPPAEPLVLGDVQTLYNTTSGASWNDYVKGGNIMNATDVPCNAATDTACVHAAEIRVLEVTGTDSCTGVTATDSLGAFNWICDDSADPVVVISNGLASGSGLQDLIDFDAVTWKDISVTVYRNGTQEDITNSTTWWDNAVVANTTGGDLDGEGTVYVVPSSTIAVAGYDMIANGVSLVAAPGVIINGPGGGSASYVISSTGMDFIWVEGMAINALGDDIGVYLDHVNFSNIRSIIANSADQGISTGVYLRVSSYNTLKAIIANDNAGTGVYLNSSWNNSLTDVNGSNNMGGGILLSSSTENTLSGVTAQNNTSSGIRLTSSSGNTLSDVTAQNNTSNGVWLISSSGNTLSDVTASNNGSIGVSLSASSDDNILADVIASDNGMSGIRLYTTSGNTLSGIAASNNGNAGVYLQDSTDNTLAGITTSHNTNYGVYLATSTNNWLYGVTASQQSANGIMMETSSDNTLSSVVASNNQNAGIRSYVSSGNTYSDITSSNNATRGIELYNSSNNAFTGTLQVGNHDSGYCYVYNSADYTLSNPGLDDDTSFGDEGNDIVHSGNVCQQEGASDFGTSVFPAETLSSFIGNIITNDALNSSDTGGTALYDDITDWGSFDNPFRLWGALSLPAPGHRGVCVTGETCQIWDWSLDTDDTTLKDKLAVPTGDNIITHTWFDASTTTFLRSAIEILDDGIGNDNLLCESGETCLYTPNMGSYQGHGAILNTASVFAPGTLTGISLKEYEFNGY